MKRNLGRTIVLMMMFLHLSLHATTYNWEIATNKTKAYVHEAIYLKYVCTFSDRGELYSIEFNPQGENETYKLELLSHHEAIVGDQRVVTYEFIAFAKKAGVIDFTFDYTMKKTTKESIEYTVIGRDNTRKEEFTAQYKRFESLVVEIMPVETDLVGVFTIGTQTGEAQVQAYEPFHLEVTIEGEGSFYLLKAFDLAMEGVKVFAQEPQIETELSQNGYRGKWSQTFAFVSEGNFTIGGREIRFFNPNSGQYDILEIQPVDVEVVRGFKKEELLDISPKQKEWEFTKDYLYYLFFFLFGYTAAKIKIGRKKPSAAVNDTLAEKITHAKSLEEISILLVLSENEVYKTWIDKIENKEVTSLRFVKKELSKLI